MSTDFRDENLAGNTQLRVPCFLCVGSKFVA